MKIEALRCDLCNKQEEVLGGQYRPACAGWVHMEAWRAVRVMQPSAMPSAMPHTVAVMREYAPAPVVDRIVEASMRDSGMDGAVESVLELRAVSVDVCPTCLLVDGVLRITALLDRKLGEPPRRGYEESLMMSLDLLLSSEAGPEVVRTLRAVLAGEMAAALRDYEERQADRERMLQCRKITGWLVYPTSAHRRDGLDLVSYSRSASQVEPPRFCAKFPSTASGMQPLIVLRADNVADGMGEADRRWPMPDWWLRIDAEGDK